MMKKMNKKVILITGTSKGIGKSLANYYLSKNHIVIGCSRKYSNIKHQNYSHYNLDITDEKKLNIYLKKQGKIIVG